MPDRTDRGRPGPVLHLVRDSEPANDRAGSARSRRRSLLPRRMAHAIGLPAALRPALFAALLGGAASYLLHHPALLEGALPLPVVRAGLLAAFALLVARTAAASVPLGLLVVGGAGLLLQDGTTFGDPRLVQVALLSGLLGLAWRGVAGPGRAQDVDRPS